ncbi:unnamed protein product [Merluccius merluccius]
MLKQIGPAPHRTGAGAERLRGGLVLRACLLLTALSVCAHVYLERARGRRAPPPAAPPAAIRSGRPTPASRPGDDKPEAGTTRPGRALGPRASYVRGGAPKRRDPSLAREMEADGRAQHSKISQQIDRP